MRKAAGAIAIVLAVFAGALYWSPHIALASIGNAVEKRDSAAVSEYVDFPVLREDLKGKLMIKMTRSMQSELAGNPFAAMGQMLAVGMVNQMVDAFVSPAGVMMMMENGKPVKSSGGTVSSPTTSQKPKKDFQIDYQGWTRVRVAPKGEEGGLIFRRDGLFSWKLVAVDIPE